MAKKVQAMVKLQIPAGKATPAPPVGTALGPHGVNIMDFVKAFNARTAKDDGLIIPAVVTIYSDRSYTFITKTPPASVLLKRAANIAKGSAVPNKNKVGTVTAKQVEEIAKLKMPDLNCDSIESAVRTVAGHGPLDGPGRRRIATSESAKADGLIRLTPRLETHENTRQEIHGGARAGREPALRAGGRAAAGPEDQVRQVRRDRRAVDSPGRRSQARRPDGARHRRAAARPGQVEDACWSSPAPTSRRKPRRPAPTSSAAKSWSRRSTAAGRTSTPSSPRPT